MFEEISHRFRISGNLVLEFIGYSLGNLSIP